MKILLACADRKGGWPIYDLRIEYLGSIFRENMIISGASVKFPTV